ncbi:MAG: alpha-hydroxy acid oxidase [Pikeienuella sp.]
MPMELSLPDLPSGMASLSDFRLAAQRRLPHFAFEYLDGGIGRDVGLARNYSAMDRVRLTPEIRDAGPEPDASTELLGRRWALPFGVAPVGLSGLFHPHAARMLAARATKLNLPFCLSVVSTDSTESVARDAGRPPWQQLYWPRDADVQNDILARMKALDVDTLMPTVDIPGWQWRERSVRAGSTGAPTAMMKLKAVLSRPGWALAQARRGPPGFPNFAPYVTGGPAAIEQWMFRETLRQVGVEEMKSLRDRWHGKIIVKGVMSPKDAEAFAAIGMDGIVVSNHGGRQLDAAPAGVELLPPIVDAVKGKIAILADGGIADGLDVLRMLRLGADFVLVGRLPYYAMGGLGDRGVGALDLLALQVRAVMTQLGIAKLDELASIKMDLD